MKNQDSTGLNSPLWIANWSNDTWTVVTWIVILAAISALAALAFK